jgi:hypothetical protein
MCLGELLSCELENCCGLLRKQLMGSGQCAKQTLNVTITFELTELQRRTGQFLAVLKYFKILHV